MFEPDMIFLSRYIKQPQEDSIQQMKMELIAVIREGQSPFRLQRRYQRRTSIMGGLFETIGGTPIAHNREKRPNLGIRTCRLSGLTYVCIRILWV
ncbi:hypothetical protein EB820_01065 [Brevibacillus agri]|uniref:Uncharacterized protein n=1 Tax=Brevibacillus agri TaxID=51101 RepID=A0A3M8BEE3_9BACL|nr:hypothetical protein BA6348_23370 [Brevibacillus agri]RNB61255.1 hypothetical protein EB820_01065 [Brevibacillus agri]